MLMASLSDVLENKRSCNSKTIAKFENPQDPFLRVTLFLDVQGLVQHTQRLRMITFFQAATTH